MLDRIWGYGCKVYNLEALLGAITDRREKGRIPTKAAVIPAFFMHLCRLGSLNALREMKGTRLWRRLTGWPLPSQKAFGYIFARLNLDPLREALFALYHKLRRNKALGLVAGFQVAAMDGHELNASYKRCCEQCLTRKVKTAHGVKVQYYHRVVTLQLLGPKFQLLLDLELERPHEGEVAAAMRLLRRAMQRLPRAFWVVSLDALYAKAPVIKLLLKHKKDAIVVLKDERRSLLQDARGLFQAVAPKEFKRGNTTYQQWDIDGFETWGQVGRPMRVVRSLERRIVRERVGGKWQKSIKEHDWIWATTLSPHQASTESIVALGHARWRIENQGFNELTTYWHMNHMYRHDPNAIMGLVLTLALAFNLFHAFWALNLKPQARQRHTKIHWAKSIEASLRILLLWPSGKHPP